MKQLATRTTVPPGGFRYYYEETSFSVSGPSYHTWQGKCDNHEDSNNLRRRAPQEREDWLCEQLPDGWCMELAPEASTTAGPGDLLARIIKTVTGKRVSSCSRCRERATQMNEWGWIGCWLRRDTIIGWLCEALRERGHDIKEDSAWELFKAAAAEMGEKE